MSQAKSNLGTKTPRLVHAGFAVLRTPLLPFDEFERWSRRAVAELSAIETVTPDAWHRASLELLRPSVNSAAFMDAIRVASPTLHRATNDWLEGRGKTDTERLEQSLIRYLSRASFRPTPFGLFAGCSLIRIGANSDFELCPRASYTRRSRLDMDHLAELTRVVLSDRGVRLSFPLYANSSASLIGGRLHYVEAKYSGRTREYSLTAVDPIPELTQILERAKTGALYRELVADLCRAGFEPEEVDEFLNELIDTQLLIAKIEPQLTGPEAASVLADDLEAAGCAAEISDALRTMNARLSTLDALGVGVPAKQYETALAPLESLPVPIDPSKVLQVDLFKPTETISLASAVVDEIIAACEIALSFGIRPDRLAEFATRFEERYETLEVPLLEALDDEVGIGLPEPETSDRLMRRLADQMRQRERWLAELRVRAASDNTPSVELRDSDILQATAGDHLPVPDAVSALATLVAESSKGIDAGHYQVVLEHVIGPSGARMLGRFAHLHPDLERELRDYLSSEQALQPDALIAEIVHLPQGRIGNISARPVLRDYEIPYLGRGGAEEAKQLSPSDLLVSVRQGRITLRSGSLDREVHPRLSCAHSYFSARELPVYRFLAALQDHGVAGGYAWSWGVHAKASRLPRVTRGRVVLARAQWTFSRDEIQGMARVAGVIQAEAFSSWKANRGLPQYIVLVDGDNRMPVDLDKPSSVAAFLRLVRDRDHVTVEEMLPTPENLPVRGPEGRFTHEIVVPLLRRRDAAAPTPENGSGGYASPIVRAAANSSIRRHAPGKEWVYAKLYCGAGSRELVLCQIVGPLVAALESERLLDKWFFLRYADPYSHIRLRFRGPTEHLGRAMQLVSSACAPSVANGRISRLVFDTYLPEIERYGGAAAIGVCEAIFHADSSAALDILVQERMATPADDAVTRDMIALAGLHHLLTDAQLGISARINLLQRPLGNPPPSVRRERSKRFRTSRSAIAAAVAQAPENAAKSPLSGIFARRSSRINPLLAQLRALEARGDLLVPFDDILLSVTHMWINRVMPSGANVEQTLYDLLHRHYLGERARGLMAGGSENGHAEESRDSEFQPVVEPRLAE